MTNEEFARLIEKLEESSNRNPKAFQMKMLLLALSGYGYIWLMLLLSIGLMVVTIIGMAFGNANYLFGKVIFVAIIFVFTVLKALWIKIPKPKGYQLKEEEAPKLYQTVRDIQKKLKTPKIHTILLVEEFNAAMLQQPRLGPLGWHKNYLIIGLPFMQSLSKEEFDSVIAHELGHLSKAHSKFSGWVYRVRISWFQVIQRLQKKQSKALILFRKFFEWFIPKFDAYSFVLARQNEYVADSLAAEYSGSKIVSEALTRSDMVGATLENFWSNHYRDANHTAICVPPYQLLSRFLNEETKLDELLLRKCQLVATGYTDTHPSLSERLSALGYTPNVPATLELNAADYYFKDNQNKYIGLFDREWEEFYKEKWMERNFEARKLKVELKQLNEKGHSLNSEEALKRVNLIYELYGPSKAIGEYLLLVEEYKEYQEDPVILYNVGKMLLDLNDKNGITYIEKAMQLDWECRFNGLLLLRYHYKIINEQEKVNDIEDRISEWTKKLARSDQEINDWTVNEELLPVSDEREIESLKAQLNSYEVIKRAYYVKWPLKSLPERQIRFLALELKEGKNSTDFYQRIRAMIRDEVTYFCETYIFIINIEEQMGECVTSIEGSLIYDVAINLSETG